MAIEDQNNGGEVETFMKHDSLWFSDGNIILAAASSSSVNRLSMLFRVHKSILSRESQVFSDMFALPMQSMTPINNDDILEGLALIRMHDPGEDVEALLKYLYDLIRDVALTRPRHPDFAIKSRGILKLADKYGMDGVRAHFIARLRSDWPKSLEEWDRLDVAVEAIVQHRGSCTVDTWPEELLSEPVSAAILAMEYDVHDILPSIYYEMHRRYAGADWDELAESKTEFKMVEGGARWQLATGKILHLRNVVREVGETKVKALVTNKNLRIDVYDSHRCDSMTDSMKSVCFLVPWHTDKEIPLKSAVSDVLQSSRDWLRTLRQGVLQSRCEKLGVCSRCRLDFDRRFRSGRKDFWRFLQETIASASESSG